MDYITYMRKIQHILGETGAHDRIDEEKWESIVMVEFSKISKDVAIELQKDASIIWKKADRDQQLFEAPPSRILSLVLFLSSWLGWIMNEKDTSGVLTVENCLDRIKQAFYYGKKISEEYPSRDLNDR